MRDVELGAFFFFLKKKTWRELTSGPRVVIVVVAVAVAVPPESRGNFSGIGLGIDLFDVVTSWLSLKTDLECFTTPYYIYKKSVPLHLGQAVNGYMAPDLA